MFIRLRNTGTKRSEFFQTSEQFLIPEGIMGLEVERVVEIPEGEELAPLSDSGVYRRILSVGIPLTEVVRRGSLWNKLGMEA